MKVTRAVKQVVIFILSLTPSKLSTLSILMYHSVSDSAAFFSTTPEAFEQHMRYIRDKGLTSIFASDVLAERKNVRGAVCITFDDGYEDVYTNAFPILLRYGMKATVFLITSEIGGTYTGSEGKTFRLLSEKQIREMQESGLVEFMPHGHTHKKLHVLSESEWKSEIAQSAAAIESLTGNKPRVFSYPRGRTVSAIENYLEREGYEIALGVIPGLVHANANKFNLPRNAIDRHTSFREFQLKLSDTLEIYLALTRIVRI